MTRIARVFPTKTSMSPTDPDAYFDSPDMFTPTYDEAHISTVFDWDIPKAHQLADAWRKHAKIVRTGGPAFGDSGGEFMPGMYIKPGVTITSRGCPNRCGFCFVPKREGAIRELEIKPGHIIQDNNFLACSDQHKEKVFKMLKEQRRVEFAGGLEAARVTDAFVDELRGIRILQLWLAYDNPAAEKPLIRAVNRLSRYFHRYKIRCYVLIGYGEDTIQKAEQRLLRAWEIGTLPFAMLYKPGTYTKDWRKLQKTWTRPAAIKAEVAKHDQKTLGK